MQPVTLRPIEMRDWRRVHEWASTEAACRFQPWGPNRPEDSKQWRHVADVHVIQHPHSKVTERGLARIEGR